jgi:HEPN domain-containing protein
VAQERAADARILYDRGRSVAAVYLAGYAVECSLKAYLQRIGRGFPTSGQAGHDLRELWRVCGFRLAVLGDSQGNRTYFVERWNTGLRYNDTLDTVLDAGVLVEGAAQLVGWIQGQLNQRQRRQR